MDHHVPIGDIQVVDRHRHDLGDLDALAASIDKVGLIQPVVLTPDRVLIAGHRRIEACRRLGWSQIPAVTAEHLYDAADRLRAERDENTCRKAMTPSELVALGSALEELERPRAQERQQATQLVGRTSGGRAVFGSSADGGTESGAVKAHKNETAAIVSEAIGMGRTTYYQARAIVKAADDPGEDTRVRDAAQHARRRMDDTGSVGPAYAALTAARRAAEGSPDESSTEPPRSFRRMPQRAQRAALASTVSTLRGLTLGLESMQAIDPAITSEEAASWERDLSKALRVLRSLHTKVKEHAHGNR
ncbi:ParB N-terminal domain-containing protein [Spirillospora sp. NPDC127200]